MKKKTPTSLSSFFLMAALFLFAYSLFGKIISADKSGSWIQYTVDHPLHSATAVSDKISCNIDYDADSKQVNKVAVAAGVSFFDSKNSNRDANALEAVEAIKYSLVKFVSTSVTTNDTKLSVKGNLTFHGITKEISFTAEQKISGSTLTVTGSFNVSLDEFKVDRPGLLGMKIEDKILVEFKTVFTI